jgi:hypothetical protein
MVACNPQTEVTSEGFRHCHKADIISVDEPTNNQASPLEICFSMTGEERRLRLFEDNKVKMEIIEPSPIHVRERVFICSKYFLLSDGTDSENVLGHYFDNTVYRIADGQKMTSFSSRDLPKNDCSIFVF